MICRAEDGDAATIATIWNHYIRHTPVTFLPDEKSPEDIRAALRADHGVWVAGAPVVGFARLFPFRAGRGYAAAAEYTLLLAPEAVGRGFGRALLGQVEAAARGRGVHTLMAGVSAENAAGLAFHLACGFAEAARLREVGTKFGRRLDLLLMQKFL